jgi:cytochrome P450
MHADDIDLEDLNLWTGPRSTIDESFAVLRAERPRAFMQEISPDGSRHGGYWTLSTYADVVDVSRRAADFSNSRGVNVGDMPPDLTEYFGSIIAMDDPKHARIRSIVARGFTPRSVTELGTQTAVLANELIDEMAEKGSCDFVTEFSALLPLRIIMNMMGIPRSEETMIFNNTNRLLGSTDPEYIPDQSKRGLRTALQECSSELDALVRDLAEKRLKDPQNDLITKLITPDSEGESLTPTELASFFILLVGAGNETTRNAISHGLLALTNNPDQRALWTSDFEKWVTPAVEEIVRYASPVLHMRRTVVNDGTRIGTSDQVFNAGDKVIVWYYSANRDEKVFTNPHAFDITRPHTDHIAFGAPGPHFCLGAHLARREISIAFRELLRRLPDIRSVGEPDFLRANFLNGIKHLQCEFTPVSRSTPAL